MHRDASSRNSSANNHEIKHFLAALDQLGENFGHNRDTYYSLGRYFWLYRCVTFKY